MKLPHTILKGDSKLCPRKLYRGNADLLRFSQRALDAHPYQQCDRAAEPGDPPTDAGGRELGCKKYMNMKHLEAALDDAPIAG